MPDSPLLPQWYVLVDPDRPQAVTLQGVADDCFTAQFGPDNRNLALFAGFLFDRAQLIQELGLDSASSDVAVLISAWYRLDGNYLMAIWDASKKHLTIGRDAMGFYPVYYSSYQGRLWFGPNVLALAHSGELPCVPNRQSLALRLANSTPSQGETFFGGIRRLPPGHRLAWQTGSQPELNAYWDPLPNDDEPWLAEDQVLEEFETRLQQAIDRCLQLSPDGITFSGGLDSTAVATLATATTTRSGIPPLTAYSAIAPPGYPGDDGESWQQLVTDFLGLPYRSSDARQRLGNRTLMEANLEEVPRLPAPTMVWWVGAFLRFYRSISEQGSQCLLTGNGGDDWLGVPEWWAADLLRSGRLGTATRFLRSSIRSGGRSWRYGVQELIWRRGLRTLLESHWSRLAPGHSDGIKRRRLERSVPPWLCPSVEDRRQLLDTLHLRRASLLDPSGTRPGSVLRHLNRHALESPFVQFERERNFHEERMVGLLLLHPFLDRQWVEFATRVSPETLLHGGQYKGLLRPILRHHLPGLAIETQRKGYPAQGQDFLQQSFASSLPLAWQSTQIKALQDLSLIDGGSLLEAGSAQTTSHLERTQLFTLLSTECWVESHFRFRSV